MPGPKIQAGGTLAVAPDDGGWIMMVTRRTAAGALALGFMSLAASGAEAKPADCLFGVEGSFRLTMDGALRY